MLWFTFHCDNITKGVSSLTQRRPLHVYHVNPLNQWHGWMCMTQPTQIQTTFFGADFMFTPRGATSTPFKWNKLSVSLHRTNKWYAKVLNILLSNYSIYMPAGSGARRHSHLALSGYRFFFSSTRISFSLHHALPLTLEWKESKKKNNTKQIWTMLPAARGVDEERKKKKQHDPRINTASEGNQKNIE